MIQVKITLGFAGELVLISTINGKATLNAALELASSSMIAATAEPWQCLGAAGSQS